MAKYMRVGNRTLTESEYKVTSPELLKDYADEAARTASARQQALIDAVRGAQPKTNMTFDIRPEAIAAAEAKLAEIEAAQTAPLISEVEAEAASAPAESVQTEAEVEAPAEGKRRSKKAE